MANRARVHHELVIKSTWSSRGCCDCYACSLTVNGVEKVNRGAASGYSIFDQDAHELNEGHIRRVAAGRAATVHVRLRARADGIPYSRIRMVRVTTHRCQACSLDADSNPKARHHQMHRSNVVEHVDTDEHRRRLLDGRWEAFAARGVEWVCPPHVPGG